MRSVVSKEHVQLAQFIRENMATFQEAEDLINIGAYRSGANPKIDQAIQYNERIAEFLKQDVNEPSHLSSTVDYLASIAGGR
jgi:flagellum-specific ATP synthase